MAKKTKIIKQVYYVLSGDLNEKVEIEGDEDSLPLRAEAATLALENKSKNKEPFSLAIAFMVRKRGEIKKNATLFLTSVIASNASNPLLHKQALELEAAISKEK